MTLFVLSRLLIVATAALSLAACQDNAAQGVAVTLPPTQRAVALATTAVPTPRPPTLTLTPTPSVTPSPSFTPSMTPTRTPTPEPPTAAPTLQRRSLFSLVRPIARTGSDWVDRTYPYGSTQFGRYPIHHGVEFQNPRGTPILAAAPGTVYYAGEDAERLFGPQYDYYGRLVIVEHDFLSPEGHKVYTLYGHLNRIEAVTGQRVEQGTQLGAVGDSGIAIGPHLHFEVRLGDPDDFGATRNPEMWLYPYPTFGTLIGRVVTTAGDLLPGVTVQVRRPGRTVTRYAYSYEGDSVNPDAVWGENFTLGDLSEDTYEVIVSESSGRVRFRQEITILDRQPTWIEIVLDE